MDSSQSGFRLVDVLKGCLLSPLRFNIFLEAVIAIALYGNSSSAMINAIEILSNLYALQTETTLLMSLQKPHLTYLQKSVDGIVKTSTCMGMRIKYLGKDATVISD